MVEGEGGGVSGRWTVIDLLDVRGGQEPLVLGEFDSSEQASEFVSGLPEPTGRYAISGSNERGVGHDRTGEGRRRLQVVRDGDVPIYSLTLEQLDGAGDATGEEFVIEGTVAQLRDVLERASAALDELE